MAAELPPPTPEGEVFYQELVWVHGMIRRDLATVGALAADVERGLAPADLTDQIRTLQTTGPLWQLRMSCLRYCRFVHHHHRIEDLALFPALRRTNPALGPVVDRLQADHRQVSDILDEVEAAAAALEETDTTDVRSRVVSALEHLARHLLEHLAFEEESVADTIRGWSAATLFG